MFGMLQFLCRYVFTFTMVLLCLMNVWKPSQRSFIQSSNATITRASNSRVAWTYRDRTQPLTSNPAAPEWCRPVSVVVCVYARKHPGVVMVQREPHRVTGPSVGLLLAAPSCRTGGCEQTSMLPAPLDSEGVWRTYHCSLLPMDQPHTHTSTFRLIIQVWKWYICSTALYHSPELYL